MIKNNDLFRILDFPWFAMGNERFQGNDEGLSFACVCVSSGPGSGAGDSSAEGARASRRAEEETLRAGWGSGGLGRARRG